MIATIIMMSILVIIAIVAFQYSQQNSNDTRQTAAGSEAAAAAQAGVAASIYGIVNTANGSFPCSVTSQNGSNEQYLLAHSLDPANTGNEQFTTTITYYATDWSQSQSPPTPISGCPTSANATPAAAIIASTGTSKIGLLSSSETIDEHLGIQTLPQGYVVFSAGSTALDLHNLTLKAPASGNGGVVYTDGGVTNSGSCGSGPAATIVAFGNSSLTNCGTVAGAIEIGNGNLTLSQTAVDGNVTVGGTVSGGPPSVTISDAGNAPNTGINGDVSASGNVYLCPSNGIQPTGCTTPAGQTIIWGSAMSSTGSVEIDGTPQLPTACPGSVTSSNGVTIEQCVSPDSGDAVNPPSSYSLPAMGTPSSAAWAADGYPNYVTASNCTGTATTPGSVLYDLANLTGNTVINATCGSTTLSLSGNIKLGSGPTNYNVALYVSGTGGINLGNTQFQSSAPGTVQMTLVETEPAGYSYSSSCTGSNYNITDGDNNLAQNTVNMFIYTPCTFAFSGGGNLTGEIMAGNVTMSKPLTLTYGGFTPPGLVFGYQTTVEQRLTRL